MAHVQTSGKLHFKQSHTVLGFDISFVLQRWHEISKFLFILIISCNTDLHKHFHGMYDLKDNEQINILRRTS